MNAALEAECRASTFLVVAHVGAMVDSPQRDAAHDQGTGIRAICLTSPTHEEFRESDRRQLDRPNSSSD